MDVGALTTLGTVALIDRVKRPQGGSSGSDCRVITVRNEAREGK
jgi:hypothetical protein